MFGQSAAQLTNLNENYKVHQQPLVAPQLQAHQVLSSVDTFTSVRRLSEEEHF